MLITLVKDCLSYTCGNYTFTKETSSLEVPDDVGAYLLSTGNFKAGEAPAEAKEKTDDTPTITTGNFKQETSAPAPVDGVSDVSAMTASELNALAKELGVEFPANAKKDEKIEILSNFLGAKGEE